MVLGFHSDAVALNRNAVVWIENVVLFARDSNRFWATSFQADQAEHNGQSAAMCCSVILEESMSWRKRIQHRRTP